MKAIKLSISVTSNCQVVPEMHSAVCSTKNHLFNVHLSQMNQLRFVHPSTFGLNSTLFISY